MLPQNRHVETLHNWYRFGEFLSQIYVDTFCSSSSCQRKCWGWWSFLSALLSLATHILSLSICSPLCARKSKSCDPERSFRIYLFYGRYTGLTLNAIADELVGFVVGKIGQQQRIEDQVLKATHAVMIYLVSFLLRTFLWSQVPAAQITFSNGSYNDLKSLHRNGNVKLLNGTSISGGFLNVSLFVRIPLALNKSQVRKRRLHLTLVY